MRIHQSCMNNFSTPLIAILIPDLVEPFFVLSISITRPYSHPSWVFFGSVEFHAQIPREPPSSVFILGFELIKCIHQDHHCNTICLRVDR